MDSPKELITEEQLDPKLVTLFLKAQSAIELSNYDYALQILHNILKEEPTFLKGRQILRAAQGAKWRAGGKKGKGLLSGAGGMMKVKNKIKKDPLGSLDDIEKKLDSDPYNVEANTLFYEAFMALGIPEIATFGLETIREGHPSDTKNLHKLGDHF